MSKKKQVIKPREYQVHLNDVYKDLSKRKFDEKSRLSHLSYLTVQARLNAEGSEKQLSTSKRDNEAYVKLQHEAIAKAKSRDIKRGR